MSKGILSRVTIYIAFLLLLGPVSGQSEELELVLQAGHTQAVTDSVWLDEEHLVSGSDDGSVKLWHVPSQRVRRTVWPPVEESKLDSFGHSVTDLELTTEGVWVVHNNGVLRLWDMKSGELKRHHTLPEDHRGAALRVVADKRGFLYAYGQGTGILKLDPAGKTEHLDTQRQVTDLVVSQGDSPLLAFQDSKGTHFGNFQSQETLAQTTSSRWGVDSLLFSDSGDILYLGTRVNWLEAWDLKEKRLLYRLAVNSDAPSEETLKGQGYGGNNLGLLLANFNESHLLALSPDGTVYKVKKEDPGVEKFLEFGAFNLSNLSLSPSGKQLSAGYSSSGESPVPLVQETGGKWQVRHLGGSGLNFTDLAQSEGKLYFTSSHAKVLSYDLSTGQPSQLFQTGYFPAVLLSADSLFCGGNDGILYAYNKQTGALRWKKDLANMGARYGYGIQDLALSPDGRDLAASVVKSPSVVIFLDAGSGEIKQEMRTDATVSKLLFSPDGKQLFLADSQKISLYDLGYRKMLHTWSTAKYRPNWIVDMANHPSDDAILCLLRDGTLVKADRHRLDLEPESFPIPGINQARSLDFAGSNLLIAADHGAVLASPKGQVLKHYGDHLAGVSDALMVGESVLTSGWDTRVELWDRASAQKKATLLSLDEGAEWLVLSPDYHFDGSEKAQGLIEWRWKGELFELSRFFERYYQPGLLARSLNGERESNSPVTTRGLGSHPPAVTISPPIALDAGFFEVSIKVEGEHSGWDDVRLYHNGHRVAGRSPFKLKAVEGQNHLRASAFNTDKTVESEPHRLVFESKTPQAKSSLHIFAAAVDDYPNALNFAVKDAESFVGAFEPGLYDKVNKVTLYDKMANKQGIIDALSQIKCEPQDTLLVFLAGHGTIIDNRFHFLPYGSEGESSEKALSSQELGQILALLPATRQVLFLDTCHAGASAKDLADLLVEKDPSLLSSQKGSQLIRDQKILARQAGTFLIAGSTPSATAAEIPELGHGLFTYAVLNGLKGEGSEQEITVNELLRYLNEKVPELSLKFRGNPHGIWQFSAGQDFPIARP